MPAHVDLQSARSHEFVIANIADVGSLSGVPAPMVGQVSLCGKRDIAICKVALERLLPVMYPHMSE